MDTKLFVRKQPGGMFSVIDKQFCTGNIWWVDSTNSAASDSAGYGRNPDAPFATLDGAIDYGATAAGDTIFLMPGHAESETTAATAIATMDVAHTRVIGLGTGSKIPTFTIGAADATFSITGANCTIENIKIISDIADCAVGVTCGAAADGLTVRNCWFTDGGLTKELVIGLQLAAACDNCLIEGNRFFTNISAETGGCASAIKLVGESANTRIIGNQSVGHYTTANIDGSTALATNLWVMNNTLVNIDTGAGLCISVHASTVGVFVGNMLGGTKGNTRPLTDCSASYAFENYGTEAVNTNAQIVLATTTNFAA